MKMKIINNQCYELCYELLAEFDREGYPKHFILRQNDVALLYSEVNSKFNGLKIIENFVDSLEKKTKKETIEYFNEIMVVMKKYNRNVVIDELMYGISPISLEGVSPLTLAC